MDCIYKEGHRYNESQSLIPRIKAIAEEIMGWLVLSSVDEKAIAKLLPDGLDAESLYFVLGHATLGGVELAMSRLFQRKTEWLGKEHRSQCSSFHIPIAQEYLTDDVNENVRKLLLEIWNKVFDSPEDQKREETELTKLEIDQLNAALKSRRKKRRDKEHYYFAFELGDIEPETVKKIFSVLLGKDKLNQMTVVEMGSDQGSKVLLLDEVSVISEINEFYRAINRDSTQELVTV